MKLMNIHPEQLLRDAFVHDMRMFAWCVAFSTVLPMATVAVCMFFFEMHGMQPWALGVFAWVATSVCMIAVYALSHYRELRKRLVPIASRASLGDVAATFVHDIRSPLTSLRAATNYLKANDQAAPMWEQCIDLLETSCLRIDNMANDFLDSTDRAHKKRLHVDLEAVAAGLVREYKAREDLPKVKIEFKADVKQVFMDGIASHIERTLANVINNAIEAMKKQGEIVVGVHSEGDSVAVSVKDSGCGMSAEMVESILGGKGVSQGKRDGHGIGLQFVLQTIEDHGGELDIESVPGEGTKFIMSFPRSVSVACDVLPLRKAQ